MSDKERYLRALAAAERDSDGCLLTAPAVVIVVVVGVPLLLGLLPYA